MYATRAATPLAESHPFKFATAYRTVANGKRGRAPAPPASAFYTRVYTCPSTSTPYLLLLPIPHARKPSYALTNLQRSERERERVVGSRGRRRDSKSLAGEKDKEGVEEEPRVQGSSLDGGNTRNRRIKTTNPLQSLLTSPPSTCLQQRAGAKTSPI